MQRPKKIDFLEVGINSFNCQFDELMKISRKMSHWYFIFLYFLGVMAAVLYVIHGLQSLMHSQKKSQDIPKELKVQEKSLDFVKKNLYQSMYGKLRIFVTISGLTLAKYYLECL